MKIFDIFQEPLSFAVNALKKIITERIEFSELDKEKLLSACGDDRNTVYILRAENILDYLVLKYALEMSGIPFPTVSVPAISTLFAPTNLPSGLLGRLIMGPEHEEDTVARKVIDGESALVGLFSPGTIFNPKDTPKASGFIYDLTCQIRSAEKSGREIVAIPVISVWHRHSVRLEKKNQDILETFLGTSEHTGTLKTAILSIISGFRPVIKIGKPLNLTTYVHQQGKLPNRAISRNIRILMEQSLESEMRLFLGPVLTPYDEMRRELAHNPAVINELMNSIENGMAQKQAIKELNSAISEIPSAPSTAILTLYKHVLNYLWAIIYRGFEIDDHGFARMREAADKSSLLIVPCHRSHIDYLVLSWIMDKYHMPIPHIAAGKNLSFWPMGTIFRGGGAFFIRRTFRGNHLYRTVLSEYLATLFRRGINVEFFMEGTRSRTGKIVYPKTGMFAIIADLVAQGKIDAPTIVPVSIGYERVIEDSSYLEEDYGRPKEKENFTLVLKNLSVILKKYGRANIRIGEPFSMQEILADNSRDFAARVEMMGFRTADEIVRNTMITSSMVFATAILSHEGSYTWSELYNKFVMYRDFALENGAVLSKTLQNRDTLEKYFLKSLRSFKSHIIEKGGYLQPSPEHRKFLSYYKNGYVQVIAKQALSIWSHSFGVGGKVMHAYIWNQMKREFAHLNCYDANESWEISNSSSEKYSHLQKDAGWFFIHLIAGQLACARALRTEMDRKTTISALTSRCVKQANDLLSDRYSWLTESVSISIYKETIELFVANGILSQTGQDIAVIKPDDLDLEIQVRLELLEKLIEFVS